MVGTIVHQLTKDASIEEIEKAGLGAYYTDHGVGLQYLLILLICELFLQYIWCIISYFTNYVNKMNFKV